MSPTARSPAAAVSGTVAAPAFGVSADALLVLPNLEDLELCTCGIPPSPTPAVSDTVAGPGRNVSVDPALLAGVATESQAPLGPGVHQKDADVVNAKCCGRCESTGKRNLVVCIDGTSNQFSTKNTNVVELYSRLVKDKTQLTFYNSGIGTYAKPSWRSWEYCKQVIASTLDLAFALRFEKIIISAYAWLVDNYEDGDCIFLFGFSRGAYQVRALAAMIHIVGLLHKGNDDQIPFAYELYAASGDTKKAHMADAPGKTERDIRPLPEKITQAWRSARGKNSSPPSFPWPAPARKEDRQPCDQRSGDEYGITMQEQFKRTFSRKNVGVHFVGAWDTVSSVGLIRDKNLPSTTDGMDFVCFFRHALALHEFRVKFLPEYANGGAGPDISHSHPFGGEPHTKEVWFTGSHSDIGGGSTTNTNLNKFGPALRWMSWEATLAGLRIVESPDSWEPTGVSKSMTTTWSIVECLPIKCLTYHIDIRHEGPSFSWRPHFFARRRILPGQRIHQSVYEECSHFQAPEDVSEELDAYLVLRPQDEVMRTGRILSTQSRKSLQQLASSQNGIQSLRSLDITQYIYDVAQLCRNRPAVRGQIFEDLQEILVAFVTGCFKVHQNQIGADATKTTSSATFPFHMRGHTGLVSSVAFLSDLSVISGSNDRTLRIWDVSTGEMTLGSPLNGYEREITCVAVQGAKVFVSFASSDSIIRLRRSDSNGAFHTGKVLQDERNVRISTVAFSPDGLHLVSGSQNGAINVWDVETGDRAGEPVQGHTGSVWSVAFSSDGKQIVSGSSDHTVQLWDWSSDRTTLQPCGEPLRGHTDSVFSVAFSPDASAIASGSKDWNMLIWDAATRTSKFTPEGHTNWVRSVAFTPSGAHVVSGSDDWTVRVWDARTADAVCVLRGHTSWVWSVAISPDGRRIASGSWDKTVRVWDFVPLPDESHANEDVQTVPARIEST